MKALTCWSLINRSRGGEEKRDEGEVTRYQGSVERPSLEKKEETGEGSTGDDRDVLFVERSQLQEYKGRKDQRLKK